MAAPQDTKLAPHPCPNCRFPTAPAWIGTALCAALCGVCRLKIGSTHACQKCGGSTYACAHGNTPKLCSNCHKKAGALGQKHAIRCEYCTINTLHKISVDLSRLVARHHMKQSTLTDAQRLAALKSNTRAEMASRIEKIPENAVSLESIGAQYLPVIKMLILEV